MVDRREFITSVATAGTIAIAGCSGEQEGTSEGELTDSVIDANTSDIIVTLDDLESGWSGGVEGEGQAVFLNEGRTVEIVITDHSGISEAQTAYDELKSENTEKTASDAVSYGNEGFLVNPFEDYITIGFRAANFVAKIDSFTQESSFANPESDGRDFAEIIIEKISNAQNN